MVNRGESQKIKHSRIYSNNCMFYIHPKKYSIFLKNIYEILSDRGKYYAFNEPDFATRTLWYKNVSGSIKGMGLSVFSKLSPLYSINESGFWIKEKDLAKIAKK